MPGKRPSSSSRFLVRIVLILAVSAASLAFGVPVVSFLVAARRHIAAGVRSPVGVAVLAGVVVGDFAGCRPRVDGVTIRKGFAGATFLPQVWEQLPDAQAFLSHLCLKAGLAGDAWRQADLEVETYQVQYFEEDR